MGDLSSVPAVSLGPMNLNALRVAIDGRASGDVERYLVSPTVAGSITLPLPRERAAFGGDSSFTVEFSTFGSVTGPDTRFLHLVVQQGSVCRLISLAQRAVDGLSYDLAQTFNTNFLQNQWTPWSISVNGDGVRWAVLEGEPPQPWCNFIRFPTRYERMAVRAIMLGWEPRYTVAGMALCFAEVRVWGGSTPLTEPAEQLEELANRRLHGYESNLVGYWRLGEGSGNQLQNSSRFASAETRGTLTEGSWLSAADSSLKLDCSLEHFRKRRQDLQAKALMIQGLRDTVEQGTFTNHELDQHIERLKGQLATAEARTKDIPGKTATAKITENSNFDEWKKATGPRGEVTLDDFTEAFISRVREASMELQTPNVLHRYYLQSVGLEAKLLPIQKEGRSDFLAQFPPPVDNIKAKQLTTLSLNFEIRPPEPKQQLSSVPDVRGNTFLAAHRLLEGAGFKVEALDQATEDPKLYDRVINQEPNPGLDRPFGFPVIIMLGRASGRGPDGTSQSATA